LLFFLTFKATCADISKCCLHSNQYFKGSRQLMLWKFNKIPARIFLIVPAHVITLINSSADVNYNFKLIVQCSAFISFTLISVCTDNLNYSTFLLIQFFYYSVLIPAQLPLKIPAQVIDIRMRSRNNELMFTIPLVVLLSVYFYFTP